MSQRRRRPRWSELLDRIGRAALGLLGAEARGAKAELDEALEHLKVVALAFGLAAAVGFWALAVALAAAVVGLGHWLPLWGALLVVLALLLVVGAALALVGRGRLRRFENPARIVGRRVEDHVEFWRTEVLGIADQDAGESSDAPRAPEVADE